MSVTTTQVLCTGGRLTRWPGLLALACCGAGLLVSLGGCTTYSRTMQVEAADGARLHVDLRGRRDGEAVIVFLHGGPGSGLSSLFSFQAYPGPLLEERYVMAYLQQRGILRSSAVPDEAQTIANHTADVDRVVSMLREKFPDRPLVLMGHSWGGVLALSYAARYPQAPVDALMLVSTPVYMAGNEAESYRLALEWATRNGRRRTQHLLERLGPPPYDSLEKMMAQRNLTRRAFPAQQATDMMARMLDVGGSDVIDPAWRMAELRIARAMFKELMATDLRPDLPRMQWPLLVMVGDLDGTVMADRAVADLEGYGGEMNIVRFEQADHQVYVQDTQRFVAEVEAFIEPLLPVR